MLCPVCRTAAVIVEYKQIELDYCTRCKGVWFDSGELALLLESLELENAGQFIDRLAEKPEAPSTEEKRRCPVCRKKMKKVLLDDSSTLVDICKNRHGIWLDNRELQRIVSLLVESGPQKAGSAAEIMGFLGEIFKY